MRRDYHPTAPRKNDACDLKVRGSLAHDFNTLGVGGMGAKELITGIGDTEKELRAAQWIIPCTRRDDGAKAVGLKFEIFGIGARANRSTKFLCRAHRVTVPTRHTGKLTKHNGAKRGIAALLFKMVFDVVRSFMGHHEGNFVCVSCISDQRDGKGDDRTACFIHGLKRISWLSRAVIHHN